MMEVFGFRITKLRLLITAILIAIAMIIPAIRRIVWWILPLGSGSDDTIFWIAFSIVAVIVFVEFWTKIRPNNPYNRRRNTG